MTLYDYGSLDGVVDEKNFKAKLGQWVATYNKIKRDVLAMPRAKAESAVLLGAVRENCCDLDGLDTVVRPVLDHWSEVGDLDALSENERRVIFLLEEYGIKLASAEGYGFLVVNWNYLNTLLLPNPSPEAQSYMTVKANQPDYFFSDGGCFYTVEEMGGWAVEWEQQLTKYPEGAYRALAGQEYHMFMEYILFSREDNTPAFPSWNNGKMEDFWIEGLQAVSAKSSGTQTAGIIADFLTALEKDGFTLSPTTEKQFAQRIVAVMQDAQPAKTSLHSGSTQAHSFVESYYETDADVAWSSVLATPKENTLTFVANPCSLDVLVQYKDGAWQGKAGQAEGIGCGTLGTAFASGQVIMEIVPIDYDAAGHVAAFEVRIPQAVREHIKRLKTSAFVEDFFIGDAVRYTLSDSGQCSIPEVVLIDPNTQNTVRLHPTGGDPGGESFLLYANEKFGYTCWIPTEFTQVVLVPDNQDGLILASPDGQSQLRTTGGYVDFLEGGFKGSFEKVKNTLTKKQLKYADFVQDEWKTFWELQWEDRGKFFWRKMVLNKETYCDLEISFPVSQQDQYESTADTVVHNFNREIEDF
ncbi:hypothetical protein MASR1M90_07080 [Desulfovibrionales bacterium]